MAYSMVLQFLHVFLVGVSGTLSVIYTAYLISLHMQKAASYVLAVYYIQLIYCLCLSYLKLKPFAKV